MRVVGYSAHHDLVSVGGVGGGGVTWGVILVRVCEPVFRNLPQYYNWSSKKMTYSYTWLNKRFTFSYMYTVLWFFIPSLLSVNKFTNKYYNIGFWAENQGKNMSIFK